jgi:hypothetical protein
MSLTSRDLNSETPEYGVIYLYIIYILYIYIYIMTTLSSNICLIQSQILVKTGK